ncbi:hypothetical protein [Staphylospora marina]|uniref:hypothetical protein n=1 Tax=Staphylospora marina TaxID=2490858 RepID=UPI000F5C1CD3|nr:hypothetical protein [Staphylospora marina]
MSWMDRAERILEALEHGESHEEKLLNVVDERWAMFQREELEQLLKSVEARLAVAEEFYDEDRKANFMTDERYSAFLTLRYLRNEIKEELEEMKIKNG